jgi:hypothetical protein
MRSRFYLGAFYRVKGIGLRVFDRINMIVRIVACRQKQKQETEKTAKNFRQD